MIRLTLRFAIAMVLMAIPAVIHESRAADIFYVTMSDNTVRKFDTDGNDLGIFASEGLNDPRGLAFDASGNLYVANYGSAILAKFNSQGAYLAAESISLGQSTSVGVAIDSAGAIYVSNENSARVRKFDAAGTLLATSPTGNTPNGLAFDGSGFLRVANRTGNTITKFDTNLNAVAGTISTNLNRPRGLAVDASGNIYAANNFTDSISKFTSSGTFLDQYLGVITPTGIAFDSQGYLYAAANREIFKLNPAGQTVARWSTGRLSTSYIAFPTTTVPEPGTMALGAIAVAAALLAKRRSRKRPV